MRREQRIEIYEHCPDLKTMYKEYRKKLLSESLAITDQPQIDNKVIRSLRTVQISVNVIKIPRILKKLKQRAAN